MLVSYAPKFTPAHGRRCKLRKVRNCASRAFRQSRSVHHAWRVGPLVVDGAGDRERDDRIRSDGVSGNDGRTVQASASTKPGKSPTISFNLPLPGVL